MAITGPPPKVNRARRNKPAIAGFQTVYVEPYKQPTLTSLFPKQINPLDTREGVEEKDRKFSPLSKRLWKALGGFPSTQQLQEAQWIMLGEAVALWDAGMKGAGIKYIQEARLQLSNYGITPADLLKLRINLADAEVKEDTARERRSRKPSTSLSGFKPTDLGGGDS